MSTIAKVQEILKDANQGEYVSLKCENDSTNINGYVVYLSKEKVDAIKLDDWTKGWPKPSDPTKYGDKIPSGGKWTRSDGVIYTPMLPYDPTHQNPITWQANDIGGTSVIYIYDKAFCDAQHIPDSMRMFFTMNFDGHDYTNSTENYEKIIEFVDSAGRRYVWSENPLCFTAEEPGSTVRFDSQAQGSPIASFYPNMNLQYSRDGQTWTVMDLNQSPSDFTLANVGDKIYFKAVTENPNGFCHGGPACQWKMTGKIAASGNIQYLLTADGSRIDVPDRCYFVMFDGCTSLTTTPELPARTLADSCYYQMFGGCTSLTTAPVLPARTLADSCYGNMFEYCSKLSSIEVNHTAWSPSSATADWVQGVSSTGTFKCPAALPQTRGTSNIPTGWSIA